MLNLGVIINFMESQSFKILWNRLKQKKVEYIKALIFSFFLEKKNETKIQDK